MTERLLLKSNLATWLGRVAASHQIIGPVQSEDGSIQFVEAAADSDFSLANDRRTESFKERILPRYEPLFVYDASKGDDAVVSCVPQPRPVLAFGLRACDTRSLSVLDAIYLDGRFQDPYYKARRDSLAVATVICESKRWSCFCSSLGDPIEWAQAGDLGFTAVDEGFVVSAFSEKGNELLKPDELFSDVTAEQARQRDGVWAALRNSDLHWDVTALAESVDWNEPVWDEIAERCVGCGVCSYLCPTCTCFDIQDEPLKGGKIERFRVRDTCQFCDFTKMGHGHNPRPGKTERVRQRISHKFKYIPQQSGIIGCVGCGRCVELCPVNSDLRKVIAEVSAKNEPESVSA